MSPVSTGDTQITGYHPVLPPASLAVVPAVLGVIFGLIAYVRRSEIIALLRG